MEKNDIIRRIFNWMAVGLFITFITASMVATNERLLMYLFSSGYSFIFYIAEIILVIFLSMRAPKMSYKGASICFTIYSFISGITFSIFFIEYQISSIIYIFGLTALVFAIMSFIGKSTKIDLSKIGVYFMIGLFVSIIVMIINIFMQNGTLDTILSIVFLILFIGITAYDVQKIDRNADLINATPSMSIIFALEIYLDFINIFISLINLLGKSKD